LRILQPDQGSNMSEQIKDVNKEIDKMEAAAKKYASKDTVISIGGYEFTPAKLMVAATLVSSILGGLYGAFEVYKDYVGMKKRIAEYVAPDLSELIKKMELTQQNSEKSVQYTQDIKNDLKSDIRRLEAIVEGVERNVKQSQRDIDLSVKQSQRDIDLSVKQSQRETEVSVREVQQELRRNTKELDQNLKALQREIDVKIQKALDNPLANR
jgi:hypothetical protein